MLRGLPSTPLFSDFVQAVADGGMIFLPVFRQLVWHLGLACESHLLSQAGAFIGPCTLDIHRAMQLGRFARPVTPLERARRDMAHAVRQYWFCARCAFASCKRLSIAVDATRVGGRSVLLAFLCTAANIAAWGPPQVRKW